MLSIANEDGFYGQPRLDISLLLQIKPENVMVTTACIKYWAYDDIDEITKTLHNHFGANFFLEIQYHNTEKQKQINRHILELSRKLGIDIILGCDSHYITESQSVERDNYLAARGIEYDSDEVGWYMDYPDEVEARRRLKERGESGGDYYRTVASRIDRRFFRLLVGSVHEGKTLYSDAFRLTNTNRSTFANLIESVGGGVK